jgi:SAM-dependent methyltransferase
MNRKQRRASQTQSPAAGIRRGGSSADNVVELFERATQHHNRGELSAAMGLYKKILTIQPDEAVVYDRLALAYVGQGKLDKASEQCAEVARRVPQMLRDFDKVIDTLKKLIPTLTPALDNPKAASLEFLTAHDARTAPGATAIAADPYLRIVLTSTPVRVIAMERWLTALRAAILRAALADKPDVDDDVLTFCAALAQQCFINEYVFSVTPVEATQVEQLETLVTAALARGEALPPLPLLAFALYSPLYTLADARALTERKWPPAVAAVVTQQVREPLEEQQLRATIPVLTPIGDGVTAQVRQQYEENPYPRWVRLGPPPNPLRILDDHIRQLFPTAPFRPVGHQDRLDVLVAGCGTGRHALEVAQGYRGAQVLGVDLSLASLSSAKRKRPAALSDAIEFAQADILNIGSLDRRFDLINASGVLHHMGDPLGGWRALIKLMKPNGLMQVGLYSAHARREIVAARKLIAERGYSASPEDIRRCRQELRAMPQPFKFIGLADFFTVSECRDLMFHVHEKQFTIPEIKDFLVENDLKFIGFEFSPQPHAYHRDVFARNGWSAGDLDRWDEYERANPDMFASMYIFWVQKNNPQ